MLFLNVRAVAVAYKLEAEQRSADSSPSLRWPMNFFAMITNFQDSSKKIRPFFELQSVRPNAIHMTVVNACSKYPGGVFEGDAELDSDAQLHWCTKRKTEVSESKTEWKHSDVSDMMKISKKVALKTKEISRDRLYYEGSSRNGNGDASTRKEEPEIKGTDFRLFLSWVSFLLRVSLKFRASRPPRSMLRKPWNSPPLTCYFSSLF